MDFIREIDKEKFIAMVANLTDGKTSRRNDAEHAQSPSGAAICFPNMEIWRKDAACGRSVLLIRSGEIDAGPDTYACW